MQWKFRKIYFYREISPEGTEPTSHVQKGTEDKKLSDRFTLYGGEQDSPPFLCELSFTATATNPYLLLPLKTNVSPSTFSYVTFSWEVAATSSSPLYQGENELTVIERDLEVGKNPLPAPSIG